MPAATQMTGSDGFLVTERRTLTLLHIGSIGPDAAGPGLPAAFEAALNALVCRHGGCRDAFATAGALALFADPLDALRVAMQLQRQATDLRLRMGLDTMACDAAFVDHGDDAFLTVLGAEAALAAHVAGTGTPGGIAISPSTYGLVRHDVHEGLSEGMLAEEYDGPYVAGASIVPAPTRGGPDLSTFVGLGAA